jgi:signal transduction histidine kinase
MKDDYPRPLNKFIHDVRNPLNSISLHAELGKILVSDKASNQQIKHAFSVILEQCKVCETLLTQQRIKNDESD